ncbi:RNA polymerase sigma-70 factor [Paenibacillus flagellatus]|uniref:RNA polymerase sigma factor SigJ n=1 Tax=Paenibacillus flagellatus TaxID=2211139 RepID=A0A2V5K519_9BACL|nr:RNA polymerase sigma-70 factor [Paenibacillus flagellatus]PYI54439.1 RNA polymerase sigma factor SigJ [Paenibacillus flagellatus]
MTTSTEQWYASYKPLLFSLAYRMLGSAADAEDIVQDTFVASAGVDESRIGNMKAYLCKMATNRCLDRLKSATRQRETYVGPWLPEPLATDVSADDPYESFALKESISTAYLLLLEQLSATERAVFLLREVYQYDYEEIADMVGKTAANCRQIFRRAKRSLHGGPEAKAIPAAAPAQGEARAVVEQFVEALAGGNVPRLLELLAADAVMLTDGGGKVRAAINPLLGADRILRFFEGIRHKYGEELRYEWRTINGGPGLVTRWGEAAVWVVTFDVRDGVLRRIYSVSNPDKINRFLDANG